MNESQSTKNVLKLPQNPLYPSFNPLKDRKNDLPEIPRASSKNKLPGIKISIPKKRKSSFIGSLKFLN